MGAEAVKPKKKRSWRNYLRAVGSAHRKASVQFESSQSLLAHLDELRRRLFKAFFAVVVTTAISFVFSDRIIEYLAGPIGGRDALVAIEITENVSIFMKVSLLCGFMLGLPFVAYQLFSFVMPGLTRREKVWVLLGVPFASLLFIGGVAFTWFVMLPTAVPFLTNFLGIRSQIRPANYFEFITRLMFWIGLCFEMPLIFMLLARLKFITARKLASGWRYAVVGMAVVAAVVTPTVDPINMGLVMLPLLGLYIISIVLAALAGRG
jgi:sec-independent protein translocase protein TatC